MIKLLKSEPLKIFYKLNHDNNSNYQTIDVKKRGCKLDMKSIKLSLLYSETRPISIAKFNDLNKLKPFLPPVDAAFYDTLKKSTVENDESD